MKFALTDKRGLTYPYIAPFRKQAKELVWDDHLGRLLRQFNEFGIRYELNKSELTIRFLDSKFKVDGADNAESLRGKSDWGGVGLDEYPGWKPYIWQEIVRPNLQVHQAWAIFAGTPKGYGNDFYRVAKLGDHQQIIDDKPSVTDPDFITFYATSYENIFLPPGEVDLAKRQSTLDFFNQEYLALFTRFTGLVYPEFDISTHVMPVEHQFNEHADYYFGLDFAVRGYTAALMAFVKPDGHVYIPERAEYRELNRTAKENTEAIKSLLLSKAEFKNYVGYADPSGFARTQQGFRRGREMTWSLADEYLEEDFPLVQANSEVVAGINFVKQLFKAKKIHIDPTNEKLIEELMQYQWKDQPLKQAGLKNEPEQVRKFNDHLVDCLRYVCYSKPQAAEELEKPREITFPIKFPPPRIEPELRENQNKYTEIDIPSIFG